ncbi:unnamed protein product [Microthlaspi erraticum]|uniref:NB-ARC domain-containing protein n=1 Tax=Microthlaspi erraticum TaxID=1685480 RepID=A0A6D2KH68_9BRAS|nr:unnamed protein product [Microthlaspi erraticum]
MQSLLHLDDEDEAMIVGICGPAGKGSSNNGLDEYGLKLCLQEQLLSKILNQNGMDIPFTCDTRKAMRPESLIILDDVDDLQQLEALADETNWFGPGSRIIVITEDQELLEQHGIDTHTMWIFQLTKKLVRSFVDMLLDGA